MKPHRFIGKFNIVSGIFKISDFELVNQIRNVLKLKVGEKIILCDGNMNERTGEIKKYGGNIVEVEILKINKNQNEPERNVVLYCSILKKENFEWVVQKATEIGVKEIVPLITVRTVKLDIRKDRLEKIIKEAAEQSGRGIVPVLYDPVNFKEAVADAGKNELNYFFDQSGSEWAKIYSDGSKSRTNSFRIGAWIGPEGGWHADEIKHVLLARRNLVKAGSLPKERNFHIISLGKTTLRAETAATVAPYLIIHNPACF